LLHKGSRETKSQASSRAAESRCRTTGCSCGSEPDGSNYNSHQENGRRKEAFMKFYKTCILLIQVFAVVMVATSAHADLTLSTESYNPVTWGPSMVGSQFIEYAVSVNNPTSGSDGHFLNVVRNDGTWVVQNLPVGFEPGLHTMATCIDQSLFSGASLYQTSLSLAPAISAPTYVSGGASTLGPGVSYLANDGFGRTDKGPFVSPGNPSNLALTFGPVVGLSYHLGVPDLAQGPNECGPTSAANSLTWLNDTYSLGLASTTAQIRNTLKNATHMKTDPAKGTTDANFLAGKNAFVKENNLPISTHVIAGGAGGPSIANILDEMKKGQDVELAMSWGNGGGHWVTLVGIIDLGAFGAGIAFNDPDDGKNQTNWSWLDGDNGFSIRSYGGLNGGNVVDLAVAESIPEPSGTALLFLFAAVAPFVRNRSAGLTKA
jgi:hypothetical protein